MKAKVIQHENYPSLKKKRLILNFSACTTLGLLSGFYISPPHTWIIYFFTLLLLILIFGIKKNQSLINSATEQNEIEINDESIVVKNKDGQIEESIDSEELESTRFKDSVLTIINKEGQEINYQLEIDSEFKKKQLETIFKKWASKGIETSLN